MDKERPQRILGIDPGSRVTGYGIIDVHGQKLTFVAADSLHLADKPLAHRLMHLLTELEKVVDKFQPDILSIEQVFIHKNPQSALILGHARGVAMVAALRAVRHMAEYTPRFVKQAVVGYGAATKQQVNHMVQVLLALPEALPQDAADALALAICHAHQGGGWGRIAGAKRKTGRGLRWADDSTIARDLD